jgi:hypothetical protein
MKYSRWVARFSVALGSALLLGWVTHGYAAEATSSCVTCHLSKEMLTKNLAVVKSKASAMQSGSG